MKAIRYHRYGSPDVIRYEDVDRPTPVDHDVLIAVRAASVNPMDRHFVKAIPYLGRLAFGLRGPKDPRLGVDVSGVVEAVGRKVTQFKPGDAVFGSCRGAFAEYACAPESALAMKPPSVSFEQAGVAGVAGYTALQGLRDKAGLRPGQKVLINGAGGGVGTFAVQIAKTLGAEVSGVCSPRNVEMVRSIGADHVIDYTREDFTRGERRYDVIFDCVGNRSLAECRRVLDRRGVYLEIGFKVGRWLRPIPRLLAVVLLSPLTSQKLTIFIAKRSSKDLALLGDMMASGALKPAIDKAFRLTDVADAFRYLDAEHARGKVVITV